ncbi:MAG: phosphoribosyltransferase family protein [Flavobacteriaceae bacterium]|nr:phosphoribosyltransferase family protein [Flavobacteriaceae bacterium]
MYFLKELLNVFFPDLCLICENNLTYNEETLCTYCRVDLPFTNFSSESNNIAERTFYGRIKLEAVTSLLFYRKKGKTQQLIHQLKYKNQQKIGALTALMLAEELKNNHRFKDLDGVIIVPMHPKKERKRGYNQVSVFGKTLAKELNIPFIENVLVKASATTSQTIKSRLQRFQDFEGKFHLNNLKSLENKHILLVDDVITTGATIESCAIELLKTKNIKISIATIAYTD